MCLHCFGLQEYHHAEPIKCPHRGQLINYLLSALDSQDSDVDKAYQIADTLAPTGVCIPSWLLIRDYFKKFVSIDEVDIQAIKASLVDFPCEKKVDQDAVVAVVTLARKVESHTWIARFLRKHGYGYYATNFEQASLTTRKQAMHLSKVEIERIIPGIQLGTCKTIVEKLGDLQACFAVPDQDDSAKSYTWFARYLRLVKLEFLLDFFVQAKLATFEDVANMTTEELRAINVVVHAQFLARKFASKDALLPCVGTVVKTPYFSGICGTIVALADEPGQNNKQAGMATIEFCFGGVMTTRMTCMVDNVEFA